MPLPSVLAACGSPCRPATRALRLASVLHPSPTPRYRAICTVPIALRPGAPAVAKPTICTRRYHGTQTAAQEQALVSSLPEEEALSEPASFRQFTRPAHKLTIQVAPQERDEAARGAAEELPQDMQDTGEEAGNETGLQEECSSAHFSENARKEHQQFSHRSKKARRQSRPAAILDALPGPTRELYWSTPADKKDRSYHSPRPGLAGEKPRRSTVWAHALHATDQMQDNVPVSLHTILARRVHHITIAPQSENQEFEFTKHELNLIASQGFSPKHIAQWAASLTTRDSLHAAAIFKPGRTAPPLFVLLLFLRRNQVRSSALGVVSRHIQTTALAEHIEWNSLKILVIRLLRHARRSWAEIMPWIASFFTTAVAKIYSQSLNSDSLGIKLRSDVVRFCNTLLSQFCLPASKNPIAASHFQERGQFQVLRFMASQSPALPVTRRGFRAIARNQLAHSKTEQEKEWAQLKGSSWPPWKEARTAMDEDKGYEFGTSRASRIFHRMYEAGYKGGDFEDMAEVYAGWDTDMSPTIQTRTLLPRFSSQYASTTLRESVIWAARIRATRTRREAWACFLAHETNEVQSTQEMYHAMFEKLHYPEHEGNDGLFPGDMKEPRAEPKTSWHLLFVREPVPTIEELYHRMRIKGILPTSRFLAFLIEIHPNFKTILELIISSDCHGLKHLLLEGDLNNDDCIKSMPGYLVASFIRFLCRFGRFTRPLTIRSLDPKQHYSRLLNDPHYSFEYAYAILMDCKINYRPAWTAYMEKLVNSRKGPTKSAEHRYNCYRILFDMLNRMAEIGLDVEDTQLHLACLSTQQAVKCALSGNLAPSDCKHVLSTASRSLRQLFDNLVSANVDPDVTISTEENNPIPPQVPGPAALHAYVRALGQLCDYRGLLSFTNWITTNHAHVTARAQLHHGGPSMLSRTIIALRAASDGALDGTRRKDPPSELVGLVKAKIERVEAWGAWPSSEQVDIYLNGDAGGKAK